MEHRILNAVFGSQREITTRKLYQYDYGQEIMFLGVLLPGTFEVHFSNTDSLGTAKTAIGENNFVTIPDEYLETGLPVYAWVFLHDEQTDGETEYKVTIPVAKRPKATNEEPTPVQQDVITQTIAALNTAAEKAEDEAERAESAADLLSHPNAVANTLAPGSSASASYENGTFTFGIPQGSKGDKGDTGEPGAKGDRGEKGDKGDQGERGEQGIQGVPGEKGEKGDRGEQGVQGEQGIQGEKGDKGDTGETGATGAKGDPGEGIATGGTPGQALIKASTADYATRWMSILPEDTASGAVASFPDGADDLPMGVVVDIDPVQDLNGYDNPWPGGGGKNKFNEQFRQGSALDLSSTSRIVASESIYVEQGKTYTFSASNYSAFNYVLNSAQADSLPISGSYNYCGAGLDWLARAITFTATNSGYVFVCVRKSDNSDIVPSDVASVKMQFEESSAATAYAPYSNICPISGRTGAKVTRTGRNLLKVKYPGRTHNGVTYVTNEDGTITLTGTASGSSYFAPNFGFYTDYMVLLPAGTYTISGSLNTNIRVYGTRYSLDGTNLGNISQDLGSGSTFTIAEPTWFTPQVYVASGASTNLTIGIQVQVGSQKTAYEPYTAVTHEIPFSTEVYGGKLNVVTGELVVDRGIVKLSEFSFSQYSTPSKHVFRATFTNVIPNVKPPATNVSDWDGLCDTFSYKPYNPLSESDNGKYAITSTSTNRVVFIDHRYSSVEDFETANADVTIVYPLATPITLTLSTTEIRSLLGDNNVWADTGDVSVTYKADIQKYIDKKISAAVAAMS